MRRAHLQGEPSGDDLCLLHQAQGFPGQARQRLAVVDQRLQLGGLSVDGALHAALPPQRRAPQAQPAQQGQAPRGGRQGPQAVRGRAQAQQDGGQAQQARHVPEKRILVIESSTIHSNITNYD